jgi:hypothetical protein
MNATLTSQSAVQCCERSIDCHQTCDSAEQWCCLNAAAVAPNAVDRVRRPNAGSPFRARYHGTGSQSGSAANLYPEIKPVDFDNLLLLVNQGSHDPGPCDRHAS